MKIELSKIQLPELDLRATVDEDKIDELASSLDAEGLLQPIGVKPIADGNYEVVFGARRTRAARLLNWETIEANVLDNADAGRNHAQKLIENVQRENLTPIEEGYALVDMIGDDELDLRKLQRRTGKSKAWLQTRLELVALPDDVQSLVQDGKLSIGAARHLGKIAHPETRTLYLSYALDNGCTEDTAKQWLALSDATTGGMLSGEQTLEALQEIAEREPHMLPNVNCFICLAVYPVTKVNTLVTCGPCQSHIIEHRQSQ